MSYLTLWVRLGSTKTKSTRLSRSHEAIHFILMRVEDETNSLALCASSVVARSLQIALDMRLTRA